MLSLTHRNLKKKKSTDNLLHTENRLVTARDAGWWWVKWVKIIKKYKLLIIK